MVTESHGSTSSPCPEPVEGQDDGKGGRNPAALRIEDAAKALGISGDMLRTDLAAGAPTNADGTVNLVHYAAWLNQQMDKNDVS